MAKSAKPSDAGMPPELNARLTELQAQSRSPSREDVAEVVGEMLQSLEGDLSEVNLKVYAELEGLAKYILAAKREIAALRPDDITSEHLPKATDELDAIVGSTEEATNGILQAMELLEGLTAGIWAVRPSSNSIAWRMPLVASSVEPTMASSSSVAFGRCSEVMSSGRSAAISRFAARIYLARPSSSA